MNADHVYSHHDDEGEDDVGENGEGLDVEELMRNVAPDVFLQCRNKGFNNFEILDKASRHLLYEECKGCDKDHTVLWMTLELLKLKARNEWSDSSFSTLLELLSKVLPKSNGLLTITYLANNIICPVTLGVEKIHATRKIPTIIRGNDRRGRTSLLQIKTVNGLKRERFLSL
jgi:hypothetical protein